MKLVGDSIICDQFSIIRLLKITDSISKDFGMAYSDFSPPDSCFRHSSRRPRFGNHVNKFTAVFCDDWRGSESRVDTGKITAIFCDDWKDDDHESWLAPCDCCQSPSKREYLNPNLAIKVSNPSTANRAKKWPGERPMYRRNPPRVYRARKKAAANCHHCQDEPSWLPIQIEEPFSPLCSMDSTPEFLSEPSITSRKRRLEDSYLGSMQESAPESPVEPQIDSNWLLFEDLLEEWNSSSSSVDTPSEPTEYYTPTTSPESSAESASEEEIDVTKNLSRP